MKPNTFIIRKGLYDNQTYASIMFDPWGEPLNNIVKFVEDENRDSTTYESGTLFETYKDGNHLVIKGKTPQEFFKEYNEMIESTLWIFNNEPFRLLPTEKVLMTGGGLAWLWQALSNNCKNVIICDISRVQIKFLMALLNEWDGDSYGEFVYNFIIKNKVVHFHVNLQEQQDKQMDRASLLKDKNNFCKLLDDNFSLLFKKYCTLKDFKEQFLLIKNKVIIKNANIFNELKNFNIHQINLSNTTNFKYNFCNNSIDKLQDLVSPATKVFIKKIKTSKNNIDASTPPCVKLDLKVPVEEIHEEILKIQQYLVPHREDSGLGWSSFCIHGQSYDRTREENYYRDVLPYDWTKEAQEHMPKTIKWLKSLGLSSLKRVRVMCLEPLGFINLHRDQTVSELGPVNIAITHPTGCEFYLENHGVLSFVPGAAYMMNLVNHHAVVNRTLERRYHIIIHGDTRPLLSNSI